MNGNQRFRLTQSLRNIAYSTIGITPINTLEHYLSVWKCGFNCCKGDVQATADGKLVMCHDVGFTFDENGRITAFDEKKYTPIRELTYAQCRELSYVEGHEALGHYAKVAAFEDFIRICSMYGMTAYPTIRETYLDEVIPELVRILKKHHMINRCIINCCDYEPLVRLHAYEPRLLMTNTIGEDKGPVTLEQVEQTLALENSGITLFYREGFCEEYPEVSISREALEYARRMEVPMFIGFVNTPEQYSMRVNMGIKGFQILRPLFPYTLTSYAFTVTEEGSTLTAADAMTESMCWDLNDPQQVLYGPIISSDVFRGMVQQSHRWDIDCCREGDELVISNIRRGNPICDFADGVLEVWLRKLPCRVSAVDGQGNAVPCRVEDGRIRIHAPQTRHARYQVLLQI